MVDFKNQLTSDISVFFNPNEFGEEHLINKKPVIILVDNDLLKELKSSNAEGLMKAEVLFFIATNKVEFSTNDKSKLTLDGKLFSINSYSEQMGISRVILEAIR